MNDADEHRDVEVARRGGATPRIEVVTGGVPTEEQAAALAIALLTAGGSGPSDPTPAPSDWQRAALLEAVGHRRLAERADLDRPADAR